MTRLFLARSRSVRRLTATLATIFAFLLVSSIGLALAQGTPPQPIKIGDTVTGTLDSKVFAQVYALSGTAGDVITVTATSQVAALRLALLITGPDGALLTQGAELNKAELSVANVTLPTTGTYQLTILRATGVQGTAKGDYTLALTGTAADGGANTIAPTQDPLATTAPAPTLVGGATAAPTTAVNTTSATVTLQQGMSITLGWNSADDMNLEVRDPVGGAVNFRTPAVTSGGRLSNNVNATCSTATANTPSETVSWPAGNVFSGSYEIIVYYNQVCIGGSAAATGSPINFALTVTVDGQTLDPLRGTLNPNQQYVASFRVDAADQVALNPGGPNLSIDLVPFAAKLSAPTLLQVGGSSQSTIDRNNAADAWAIDVPANTQPLTITMNATTGSLDTLLVLIGPDGSIITSNDDANENTRNSQIANQTLVAGRYTVVATRFALAIGGTEGGYTIGVGTGVATGTGTNNAVAAPTVASNVPTTVGSTTTTLPSGSIEITLTWTTRADLRLLVRDPAGQSVFSDNRTPDNSGILEQLGNFRCENTTTTPLTYAYWPSNLLPAGTYEVGVWLNDRCTDQVLPNYTLTVKVKGQTVINFTDRPDPNKAHMQTTFTIDASGNATAGEKGIVGTNLTADISSQLTNPPAITPGTTLAGAIDSKLPFQLYTFEAKAGDRIAIVMRSTGGNLDPRLFLLNSNRVQINENDDVEVGKDANSRIEQRITVDGTYYIVATRYAVQFGGTSGNYEVTLAQLNQ